MGVVSKNRGGFPPKWMVKIMENPIKMADLGVPLFLETPIYEMDLFFLWFLVFFYLSPWNTHQFAHSFLHLQGSTGKLLTTEAGQHCMPQVLPKLASQNIPKPC